MECALLIRIHKGKDTQLNAWLDANVLSQYVLIETFAKTSQSRHAQLLACSLEIEQDFTVQTDYHSSTYHCIELV